jgi:hypothetical protein
MAALDTDRARDSSMGWTEAGVWAKLHGLLLAELEYAGKIDDWSRAAVDSPHARARGGD